MFVACTGCLRAPDQIQRTSVSDRAQVTERSTERKVAGTEPVRLDRARGRYACTPGADWRSEMAEQTSRSARGLLRDLESWAADRGEHGVITARGYQQVAAGDRNTHRQMAELLKASVVHRTPDGGFKLAFWERNNRYRRDAECFREVNVSQAPSEIIEERPPIQRTQEEEIREREKTLSRRCAGAPPEPPSPPESAEPDPEAGEALPVGPLPGLAAGEREGPEKAPDTPQPPSPPPELTLSLTEPSERRQCAAPVIPLKKARTRRLSALDLAKARVLAVFNELMRAKGGTGSYQVHQGILANVAKAYLAENVLNEQALRASISAFLANNWWTGPGRPGHSLEAWARHHTRYDHAQPRQYNDASYDYGH